MAKEAALLPISLALLVKEFSSCSPDITLPPRVSALLTISFYSRNRLKKDSEDKVGAYLRKILEQRAQSNPKDEEVLRVAGCFWDQAGFDYQPVVTNIRDYVWR